MSMFFCYTTYDIRYNMTIHTHTYIQILNQDIKLAYAKMLIGKEIPKISSTVQKHFISKIIFFFVFLLISATYLLYVIAVVVGEIFQNIIMHQEKTENYLQP